MPITAHVQAHDLLVPHLLVVKAAKAHLQSINCLHCQNYMVILGATSLFDGVRNNTDGVPLKSEPTSLLNGRWEKDGLDFEKAISNM